MNIREKLKESKRVVIKVGTSTLTYPNGRLNLQRIEKLSWVMADIRNQGKDVILVSSGAIGVGAVRLDFKERPKETRTKQAAAAVGQAVLMQIYQNFFIQYGQKVAQILLTKEDFKEGERRQNTINTFETLLELNVIPVVNANDTISTFEIEFSDNDTLSAHVATLLNADLLILLTDIDALHDCDPKTNPHSRRISYVEEITKEIVRMAGTKGSEFSIGGMATKIEAAKICQKDGVHMVVAQGSNPTIIHQILNGDDMGTFFVGKVGEGTKKVEK